MRQGRVPHQESVSRGKETAGAAFRAPSPGSAPVRENGQDVRPAPSGVTFRDAILPLDRIDAGDRRYAWRSRKLGPARIEDLVSSIRVDGLLHPLVVEAAGKSWRIVCGFRRHAALSRLAREEARFGRVPCRVVEGALATRLLRMSHAENDRRRPVDPLEAALKIAPLVKAGETSPKEAAQDLGVTERSLRRYRELADLPRPVVEAFLDDEIGSTLAREFRDLPEETAAALLAERQARSLDATELAARIFEERHGVRELLGLLAEMPEGVRLTFDAGSVRIGVSAAGGPSALEAVLGRLEAVRERLDLWLAARSPSRPVRSLVPLSRETKDTKEAV